MGSPNAVGPRSVRGLLADRGGESESSIAPPVASYGDRVRRLGVKDRELCIVADGECEQQKRCRLFQTVRENLFG